MILTYIDEAGTNYSKGGGKHFVDGPYVIWTAVLIHENKYFHIERGFQDIAIKYLGNAWKKNELHATNIWELRKQSNTDDKKVRAYFEELFQFIAKLHIPVLFGIQQKKPSLNSKHKISIEKEMKKARYALITLIEHQLATINETSVLVADKETEKEEMKNLVFQRTKWRFSPPMKQTAVGGIKPMFPFETRSNFILDQLHYVDSKESLLVEFSDHICFVLKKVLEHLYLLNYSNVNRPKANIDFVPISQNTFNFFAGNSELMYAFYNDATKDTNMGMLNDVRNVYFRFDAPSGGGIGAAPEAYALALLDSMTPHK